MKLAQFDDQNPGPSSAKAGENNNTNIFVPIVTEE